MSKVRQWLGEAFKKVGLCKVGKAISPELPDYAVFKCRRCGEETVTDSSGHTAHAFAHKCQQGMMTLIHQCGPDKVGVCELIGFDGVQIETDEDDD